MNAMEIKIESLEKLQQYFQPDRRSMIHCAVQRKMLDLLPYRHHYIVLGHTWSPENKCRIMHYTPCSTQSGKGKVILDLCYQNIENDIKAGLYVYENDAYPQTDVEYFAAYGRFERRQNETNFSFTTNNCEHLAHYILIGNPISFQVENSSCFRLFLVDFIDFITGHGKGEICLQWTAFGIRQLLSSVCFKLYMQNITKILENENDYFDDFTDKLLLFISFILKRLSHKNGTSSFVGASWVPRLLMTGIEVCSIYFHFKSLDKRLQDGTINEEDCMMKKLKVPISFICESISYGVVPYFQNNFGSVKGLCLGCIIRIIADGVLRSGLTFGFRCYQRWRFA